ncbi:tyrosine-type recombinase/integrase [Neokomagataea anthophila]|uniref:Tyrosine-type recombinase/integrase n=1 Tax=Neokomagataea anthophila TaxID=2826925 RepID=A0ABS5E755_9PROT|nr:tyrosine-type recombinase/integrase [Neokomagataea anthophila]MBR0559732.1 tyrosine-type recombinase/integrase [Neokomagataea anthophila]
MGEFATNFATKGQSRMLIKRPSGYTFRRTIPLQYRDILGQSEIWLALGTSRRVEANAQAGALYSHLENLFLQIKGGKKLSEKFTLKKYLLERVKEHPSDFEGDNWLDVVNKRINSRSKHLEGAPQKIIDQFLTMINTRQTHMTEELNKLIQELNQAKLEGNKEREAQLNQNLALALSALNNAMNTQTQPISPLPQPAPIVQAEPCNFLEISKEYIEKRRPNIGIETIEQLVKACGLFAKFMDERQNLTDYTRRDAVKFIDLIRQLPKTYGKSSKDAGKTLDKIIEDATKKDPEYLTISEDVIKRHAGNVGKVWAYAVSVGYIQKHESNDIWTGHIYESIREKTTKRRPYKPHELQALMSTKWGSRINVNTARQIIAIGSYTGMRVEEICRLRPKDIEKIDDILCFHLQIHEAENDQTFWDPKTEAGERIIPLHSYLKSKQLGFLDRVKNCEKTKRTYIFYDVPYDKNREKKGAGFSKRFSAFKQKSGLPSDICFHSFRHLVRTKLGNRDGLNDRNLYPTEWIDQILGHETPGMGARYSREGTNPKNLLKVINTLKYENWEPHLILCR